MQLKSTVRNIFAGDFFKLIFLLESIFSSKAYVFMFGSSQLLFLHTLKMFKNKNKETRSVFTELMKEVCVVFDKCIALHNKTRFSESMPDVI